MNDLNLKLKSKLVSLRSISFFTTFLFLLTLILTPVSPLASVLTPKINAAAIDFSVDTFDIPANVKSSEILQVPLTITNTGTENWNSLVSPITQLSYKVDGTEGEKTDMISDVFVGTQLSQNISITTPATDGTYTIEIFLFDVLSSTYIQATTTQTYTLNVESPKAPVGSLIVDSDTKVLNPDVGLYEVQDILLDVNLQASSNVNVTHYKLLESLGPAISGAQLDTLMAGGSWNPLDNPSTTIDTLANLTISGGTGTYTIYVQYKNSEEQVSDVYTETIYYRAYNITPAIEVSSSDALFGGEMSIGVGITNAGSDIAYNTKLEVTLPQGFLYISPLICDGELNCYKSGDDIPAYLLEHEVGFLEPTLNTTNTDGEQILTFESVADLLPGESTSIYFLSSVGGTDHGYSLGDIVSIDVKGTLFKRTNFFQGIESLTSYQFDLKPFIVDYEGTGTQNTDDDQLVGVEMDNTITIKTNPEIPSDEPTTQTEIIDPTPEAPDSGDETTIENEVNPMEVTFTLDNGVKYIEDSMVVNNYLGDLSKVIFNVLDVNGVNALLKWSFTEQVKTDQYLTPIEIYFKTIIPKFNDDENRYVEHNEELTSNVSVEGNYTNPVPENCVPTEENTCEEISKAYVAEESNTFIAKYFTVNKWGIPNIPEGENRGVLPGDTITYHIQIKTSPEYTLSGIELTDVLPDGVTYSGNVQQLLRALSLQLFNQATDPVTGKTTLTWRITDADGITAGETYEFTYDVLVNANYLTKTSEPSDPRLLSNDSLDSNINLRGTWSDVDPSVIDGNPRTGVNEDNEGTWAEVQNVTFDDGIRKNGDSDYTKQVNAKIGDIFDIYGAITFPNVPTDNVNYKFFLPAGTKLIPGSISVSSTGTFENNPQVYTEITNGYEFNLGKVEAGSIFRVDYQIQVQDDPNLKEAVQTRNLFRAMYTNIDNERLVYRSEVTLVLIEPIVNVNKVVTAGYLARGEVASVETRISNSGSDSAFNLSIEDKLPQLSVISSQFSEGQLLVVSCKLLDSGNVVVSTIDCEWNDITQTITISYNELLPNYSILINYNVLIDANVKYGDSLASQVTIGEYSNRATDDPLPPRVYNEKIYDFNWTAKEPLLITDIYRDGYTVTDFIPVGRKDTLHLVGTVRPVGGAPVYDTEVTVDLSSINNQIPITQFQITNYELRVNENILDSTNYTLQTTNSIYTFSAIDLLPGDTLTLDFELLTDEMLPFDLEFPVSIEVIGHDAIEAEIYKDGCSSDRSVCVEADVDDDDKTETVLRTFKLDDIAPTGTISFYNPDSTEPIAVTNQNVVDVEYLGNDTSNYPGITGEIVGVQFSNDGNNWGESSMLGAMGDELKALLELDGTWNTWDGSRLLTLDSVLENEGYNYRFMKMVDLYGNIGIVEGEILKDVIPPINAKVIISPYEGDLSNPAITGVLDNYINFLAEDNCSLNEASIPCSGLGEYSYSFDNTTWSDWAAMVNGVNSIKLDFPAVNIGELLNIYLKVKDKSGNESIEIAFDNIFYQEAEVTIAIDLNGGATYTNDANVDLGLQILKSTYPITQIRVAANPADILSATYLPYSASSEDQILNKQWEDGEKTICVQVKDSILDTSNIACDSIRLDTAPPIGMIIINNGEYQTDVKDITLHIAVSDPQAQDGTDGIGAVQMRFSKYAQDCKYEIDPVEINKCLQNWSPWETYQPTKPWTLEDLIGDQFVYIQFQDGLGNMSNVMSASIEYNPLKGTGNIVINNNDTFTNTKHVNLELNVDLSTSSCAVCTKPVLMRFYQTSGDEVAPNPPDVSSAAEYDIYLASLPVGAGHWSYWQDFYTPVQWNLDPNNDGTPNYGKKTVFVQYMLANTEKIGLYNDSIIYAPYYGVEYNRSDQLSVFSDQQNKIYGLNTIPSEVYSQDTFTIKLNAKNIGSFTWPKDGENPVHITYKWVRTGGETPEGWQDDWILKEERGNSVVLPDNISWNKETGEVTLKIDTPMVPGNYQLIIDTVHEGKAWFSDFANPKPTFDVLVTQNPDVELPIPDLDPASVLGENTELAMGHDLPVPYEWEADGWGPDCEDTWSTNKYSGRNCYIQGTWNPSRDTNYHAICAYVNGGYYEYEIATINNRVFYFCPGDTGYWDQFLGDQMTAKVHWNTYSENSLGGFQIKGLKPTRHYYKSELYQSDNDAKLFSTIAVNRSQAGSPYEFAIQPIFRNTGTGIWYRGQTYLVAVDSNGNEAASPFRGSDWYSASRIYIDDNHSGWGQNTKARFTGTIHIPDNISFGIHTQCFKVMQNGVSFERSDILCMKIDVQMTYQEKRQYFCPQPHPVYKEKSETSEKIGDIQQNTEFIIKATEGDWSLIYFPVSPYEEGWVLNNLQCFGEAEVIENIIPIPEFPILPTPEGDNGYVLTLGGVDVKLGPSDGFPTIGHLPEGAHVQVLEEAYMDDNKYGGWLYVRLDPADCSAEMKANYNCEGWVPKGTILHTNDPKDVVVNLIPELIRVHVCGDSPIDAYAYPGMKTKVVGTLQPGQNVSVISTWNNWFQVYLNNNGDKGWISSLTGLCDGYMFKRDAACGGSVGYPFEQEQPYNALWGGFRSSTRPDHDGIDLAAGYGTPIIASVSGSVLGYSTYGTPGGAAKYVKIKDNNQNIQVGYWHLSAVADTVKDGWVEKGEIIGLVGNTGNVYCMVGGEWVRPGAPGTSSTCGSHLHYYIWDYSIGDFVNPWSYLGSGGGEACKVDDSNGNTTNKLAGTPQDYYGGKNGSSLSEPEIRLKVTNDDGKLSVEVKEKKLPKPEITYIDVNDDETQATIYGIAINKNMKARLKIDYFERTSCNIKVPFGGPCLDWNYKYEYREYEDTLDHTGLNFIEERSWIRGDQAFGWIWNDSADGRFSYTFNLDDNNNKDINIGDKVYLRSNVWGNTEFTVPSGCYTTKFYTDEEKGLESDKSNTEEIKNSKDLIKEIIKDKFSVEVEDGNQDWTKEELVWLFELLNEVPDKFYDHSHFKKTIRESNTGNACANTNGKGEIRVFFDFVAGGAFCDSSYGVAAGKEEFKVVVFHEMAHALANDQPSLEEQFAQVSWKDSGNTNSCYGGSATCNIFIWKEIGDTPLGGSQLTRVQELAKDFVNSYAGCHSDSINGYVDCIPTITNTSLTFSDPNYESYKEDWAESVTFFKYIRERYTNADKDSLLKLKESYLDSNVL